MNAAKLKLSYFFWVEVNMRWAFACFGYHIYVHVLNMVMHDSSWIMPVWNGTAYIKLFCFISNSNTPRLSILCSVTDTKKTHWIWGKMIRPYLLRESFFQVLYFNVLFKMLLNINVTKFKVQGRMGNRWTVNGCFKINKTKVNSMCFIADNRPYIDKTQLKCPRPGLLLSSTVVTPPLTLRSSWDSRLVQCAVTFINTRATGLNPFPRHAPGSNLNDKILCNFALCNHLLFSVSTSSSCIV
jgi:hypothetical protein